MHIIAWCPTKKSAGATPQALRSAGLVWLCGLLNLEHITQSLKNVFVSTVLQITEIDAISIFK